MDILRFVSNRNMFIGPDARRKINDVIVMLQLRKAFIVTDANLVKIGAVDKVTGELERDGIPYEIFDSVKPNPTVENVQMGVDCFMVSGADFILAFGGGSAIDTAKAIGVIARNTEFYDVVSLEGADKSKKPSIPVIAVPTTAGTGSETTMDYVITNENEKRKMACMDVNAVPAAAILDLEIMASMPASLTAATAMDALTHAVESYTAKGAWTVTETFSLKAAELIAGSLENAMEHPDDLSAWLDLATGQYLAGAAFTNAGLGIAHSMAHPLSARFGIHHGIANGMILPYVMEYNADFVSGKYARIAEAFGYRFSGGESVREKSGKAVEAVRRLLLKTGLPTSLSQLGIDRKELAGLSEDAFLDVSTQDNPREATAESIRGIYERMY